MSSLSHPIIAMITRGQYYEAHFIGEASERFDNLPKVKGTKGQKWNSKAYFLEFYSVIIACS